MAKTSKIVKNDERRDLMARYAERRRVLRDIMPQPQVDG